MFITVQLFNGNTKLLTYSVGERWIGALHIGSIVQVPVRDRTEYGLVIADNVQLSAPVHFVIKPIISLVSFGQDDLHRRFIDLLARYYQTEPFIFMRKLQSCITDSVSEEPHDEFDEPDVPDEIGKMVALLTDEQQRVVDAVVQDITAHRFVPTVVAGVTGSGKTEVYKRLVQETLLQKKTALLLLPEVTLAHRFEQIFAQQLPASFVVAGFHSKTTRMQRRMVCKRLYDRQPLVIVGVHLPILLPIDNLGLIIVDEEHEAGYQEKQHPKIHTVQAALLRAQLYQVPIVLGSATPSISSLYNVHQRGWAFFELKKRFGGIFPEIKVVNLRSSKRRKEFWISHELETAIAQRIARGEQTIIFLNRRGVSFCLQCSACGSVSRCSSCSVSLTVHEQERLVCHYCGFTKKVQKTCQSCGAVDQFIHKGIGTQKMVQMLSAIFPHARIVRVDVDVTRQKKKWKETVDALEKGNIDIIVGTQSITKGFHFPRVSLVGVIWADANAHIPHFLATEQMVQQLVQVAGRAGRSGLASTVIIQTLMDSSLYAYAHEQQYTAFYEYEIENRHSAGYPPCMRFVEIELKYHKEEIVAQEAYTLASTLIALKQKNGWAVSVLGPSVPLVGKIKGIFFRKIYLKAERFDTLVSLFELVEKKRYKAHIFFTPYPQHM